MQNNQKDLKTPEEILEQIKVTKAALSEKVEAMQKIVMEKVDEVKSSFSLKHQVASHPWETMAAAVTAGIALRKLIDPNELIGPKKLALGSALGFLKKLSDRSI